MLISNEKYEKYFKMLTTLYIFELVCGLFVMTGQKLGFLAGFPFYFTDKYFHVLGDRVTYFQRSTLLYLIVMTILYIFYRIDNHLVYQCTHQKESIKEKVEKLCNYKNPNMYLCIFLTSTLIPLLFSGNASIIWDGSDGRYQGLKMWLLYAAAYFAISNVSNLNIQLCLNFMLLGGSVSAIWGVMDFAGIDPLSWISVIKEGQRNMFMSSYGNINTYTAAMVLFMAIAGALSIKKEFPDDRKGRIHRQLYRLQFLLFCIAMITGLSDNAVVGIACFFVITAFLCQNTLELCAFFRLIQLVLYTGFIVFFYVNILHMPVSQYIDLNSGILLSLALKENIYIWSFCIIVFIEVICCILKLLNKKNVSVIKYWKILAGALTISGAIGIVGLLIFANTGHEIPGTYQKILVFNDWWGTWRGFAWRITIEEYMKFPLWKKLFGSGLETFGTVMYGARSNEMMSVAGQLFDSPHNEILQYIFTTGIIGALSLYIWYIFSCIHAIQKNNTTTVCAVSVLTYISVSFVNISVPMTQVYIILLMAFMHQKHKTTALFENAKSSLK